MSDSARLIAFGRRLARLVDRAWFEPAPADRLATLRVLIGGFAEVYLAARTVHFLRAARSPAHSFDPVGPVAVLSEPLPPMLQDVVLFATLLCGLAFVFGWRFRWFGPAFAIGLLWVLSYRNSWGMIFHTENLIVLHVAILGFSPAGDTLSARPRVPPGEVHGRYGWPVRLMALVTVTAYVIAGLAKLRNSGFEWITGDILRNYVAYDNLRKAELGDWHSPVGGFLVRHGWLFPPLAAASLVIELGAPLALVRRTWAAIWAAFAWSFHAGVLLIMAIFFPYQILGWAYLPFFRVERLTHWIHRHWVVFGSGRRSGLQETPEDPRDLRAKNA